MKSENVENDRTFVEVAHQWKSNTRSGSEIKSALARLQQWSICACHVHKFVQGRGADSRKFSLKFTP